MNAKQKSILIVEDDHSLKLAMEFSFEAAGYSVSSTTNGEDVLRLAAEKNPDVILLDVVLPKTNGFDVLKHLKTDGTTKHIPVIIFSNYSGSVDKKYALSIGASDFLVKSEFSIDAVLDLVKKYVQ